MIVKCIDKTNVDVILDKSLRFVAFCYEDLCPDCMGMKPIFDRFAERIDSTLFSIARVSLDSCPELRREFDIQSVPTIVFVSRGRVLSKLVGFLSEAQISCALSNFLSICQPDSTQQIRQQLKEFLG